MRIRRITELKFPDEYRALVSKSRGIAKKRREIEIANKLHEVHRPYWQRYEETKMNFDLD